MSRPCYRIDSAALDQARSDLGLELDVRVIVERLKAPDKRIFVCGRYTGIDPFHSWHNVWVNPNQTAESANASLWHELMHALQCERMGSYAIFDSVYRQQQREFGIPYGAPGYFEKYADAMPLETEAWAATDLYRAGQLHPVLFLSGDSATVEI